MKRSSNRKSFLFFFVHPSKINVFRQTISSLKQAGHDVDIAITSKDVLEELVKETGWKYTNIFPQGRRFTGLPKQISLLVNTLRTIWRLWRMTSRKTYDLYITDDLLSVVGGLRRIPTITFCDDDFSLVRKFAIVLAPSKHILAPKVTDLGPFAGKKVAFDSYKELAYLHPLYFIPNREYIRAFCPTEQPYFLLRLVSLQAYHDAGKKGLENSQVQKLIDFLKPHGKVFICSERPLPPQFETYRLPIHPTLIHHAMFYSRLFIGDSQTMSSEASVLGVPNFRCNDFAGKLAVMEEKETKYKLSFSFLPSDFNSMLAKIDEILHTPNFRQVFEERRARLLSDKEDLTAFMVKLFAEYPESLIERKRNNQE